MRCGLAALLAVTLAASGAEAGVLEAATPEERALLQKLEGHKYVEARAAAEAILAAAPSSIVALWAMAVVHEEAEGNSARALFFLQRAEAELKSAGEDPVWHEKIVYEQFDLLAQMGRDAEALAMADRHDALFAPMDPTLRIWNLFKAGRVDEARRIARVGMSSNDFFSRARGYNGMASLEFELHNRDASYQWSVDGVRATQERDCILLRNAGEAAFNRFRFEEAETLMTKAAKGKAPDCPANDGYGQLAGLYLIQGELQKALAALRSFNAVRYPRRLWPQFAMNRRAITALALHALGRPKDAERVSAEVYAMPQRVGMVSGSVNHERFIRVFHYWAALGPRLQQVREQRAARPLAASLASATDAQRLALTRWTLRRELIQLLADSDRLVTFARPNLWETYEWHAWQIADLIELAGTGVVAKAIEEARAADAAYPEAAAYFDAVEGELKFRQGRLDEADALARKASASLDPREALLRWRTLAWQAEALTQLGRGGEAQALYAEVLEKFPPVFRVLELRLPVSLSDDGSEPARTARERLTGSPRFAERSGAPFRVHASARDGVVEICLRDAQGVQFTCASDKGPQSALDRFHEAAFSPRISLSQLDLNSLDGSTTSVGADQALKGVLEP